MMSQSDFLISQLSGSVFALVILVILPEILRTNTSSPCSGTGVSVFPKDYDTICKRYSAYYVKGTHLPNKIQVKTLYKNIFYSKANMNLLKVE